MHFCKLLNQFSKHFFHSNAYTCKTCILDASGDRNVDLTMYSSYSWCEVMKRNQDYTVTFLEPINSLICADWWALALSWCRVEWSVRPIRSAAVYFQVHIVKCRSSIFCEFILITRAISKLWWIQQKQIFLIAKCSCNIDLCNPINTLGYLKLTMSHIPILQYYFMHSISDFHNNWFWTTFTRLSKLRSQLKLANY